MYTDVLNHCSSCPQCAIVLLAESISHLSNEFLFQILGVDIMDLLCTESGNKLFQDYLTKFPLVFPVPDQKAI